jgi:hypothetical protein
MVNGDIPPDKVYEDDEVLAFNAMISTHRHPYIYSSFPKNT